MSITNLSNKIKSKTGLDRQTILLILTVIFVGVASFGLGCLYRIGETKEEISIEKVENSLDGGEKMIYNDIDSNEAEKRYVASKNGTKYYSRDCGGANRIKLENQIWFKNREDAEKSGFSFSSSCK